MKPSRLLVSCVACLGFSAGVMAQESDLDQPGVAALQNTAVTVPRLIRYTGTLTDTSGKPLSGKVAIQFAIYKEQNDDNPIWQETQSLALDTQGRYTALFGATQPEGLPIDLFNAGIGRWLGVQVQDTDTTPQPRVLLVAVPYALKAADADTLGGMPASAFMPATAPNEASGSHNASALPASTSSQGAKASANAAQATSVAGTGKTNYIPVWTNPITLGNSLLFQAGGRVGLGTTAPGAKLDSFGTGIALRGVSSGAGGIGVFGNATSSKGLAAGVYGETSSTAKNAAGVSGVAKAASGKTIGVWGLSASSSGTGVVGQGSEYGVTGTAANDQPKTAGVFGQATTITGVYAVYGVQGATSSYANGSAGVTGTNSAGTGLVYGVSGYTNSPTDYAAGVYGAASAIGGMVFGVNGSTNSGTTNAAGVSGSATSTSGQVYGIAGSTNSATSNAAGVNGYAGAATGRVYGVAGTTDSTTDGAAGVNGYAGGSTGAVNGVSGTSASPYGVGVVGNAPTTGVNGNASATTGFTNGVYGSCTSTTGCSGVGGNATASVTSGYTNGVFGSCASQNGCNGVNGVASALVGVNDGVSGTTASATDGTNGVFGEATANSGVTFGVQGLSLSPDGVGMQGGSPGTAVAGFNQTCNGSNCALQSGIAGKFVTGTGGTILQGLSGGSFSNLKQVFSVDSAGNGTFVGNLSVSGTLTKGSGSFKIDHPLDPANKYLSHSFVESPDMMNVYNGVIQLDARGQAWVNLPNYFEALNRDFRYQLTSVGAPAPNLYIAKEVSSNRFKIAGGKPGGRVSWQVTGIRQDAYANANRIPVEEVKPLADEGLYLHPELYGQPDYRRVGSHQYANQPHRSESPDIDSAWGGTPTAPRN